MNMSAKPHTYKSKPILTTIRKYSAEKYSLTQQSKVVEVERILLHTQQMSLDLKKEIECMLHDMPQNMADDSKEYSEDEYKRMEQIRSKIDKQAQMQIEICQIMTDRHNMIWANESKKLKGR